MRYGARIRKLANKIKDLKKEKYECPRCGKKNVVRVAPGIWQCRSCKAKIAGAAYKLNSAAGQTILNLTKKVVK